MFFIFKYILYFPTVSHPNSLQSMEKLSLLSRDFGRDSEKLLQNRIVTYLPCPVIFFFFTLIIQLVSFFHSQNWSYQCCSVQEWGLHYLSLLNWNERRLLHPWAFFPSCCYVCVYLGSFSFVLFLFCFFSFTVNKSSPEELLDSRFWIRLIRFPENSLAFYAFYVYQQIQHSSGLFNKNILDLQKKSCWASGSVFS